MRSIRFGIERKRGEEARSRLAAIVESSSDAIISLSLEGLIVSWNAGARDLFGFSFEEMIGRPVSMLAPPENRPLLEQGLGEIHAGGSVRDFEMPLVRRDGLELQVALSFSPIRNAVSRIMGASMIARDIGVRKQHERENENLIRELREALAKVQALSGLLPICAGCKKIRDDHGYWTQVELYVMARSQAEFTHGICPDCARAYRERMGLQQ